MSSFNWTLLELPFEGRLLGQEIIFICSLKALDWTDFILGIFPYTKRLLPQRQA